VKVKSTLLKNTPVKVQILLELLCITTYKLKVLKQLVIINNP